VKNLTRKLTFVARHSLSDRQVDVYLAGGLINWKKGRLWRPRLQFLPPESARSTSRRSMVAAFRRSHKNREHLASQFRQTDRNLRLPDEGLLKEVRRRWSRGELEREIYARLDANNFILYGKGGEFATNRREDQEITILSLHLLQLCLVYINTLMIQQVLHKPQWQARMHSEDLRALTPLIYSHVTPYGTFRPGHERAIGNWNGRCCLKLTPTSRLVTALLGLGRVRAHVRMLIGHVPN
jgi:hypothetical protein